jgi:DNA polymerase-1
MKVKIPNADLILIDGKHLYWRAASAVALSDDEGNATGGIFAFIQALIKLRKSMDGVMVVCWEGGRRDQLLRTSWFPEYKLKPLTPERSEVIRVMGPQLRILRHLLSALGIRQGQATGWEADDMMATLAAWGYRRGHTVAIFTGDADLRQCVNGKTFVLRPPYRKNGDSKVFFEKEVIEEHKVRPLQIPFLKALSGDGSDNYPGVRGIGPVLAAKLVNHYEHHNNLYVDLDDDAAMPKISRLSPKLWQALLDTYASGKLALYHRLAVVNDSALIDFTVGEFDMSAVVELLKTLNFKYYLRTTELWKLKDLA